MTQSSHDHLRGIYTSEIPCKQGEAGVVSTKGEASTFWFMLPLAVPDGQDVG